MSLFAMFLKVNRQNNKKLSSTTDDDGLSRGYSDSELTNYMILQYLSMYRTMVDIVAVNSVST